jgi:hypothetical protein
VLTVGSKAASELSKVFADRSSLSVLATSQASPSNRPNLKNELACLAALASKSEPPAMRDSRFDNARSLVQKLKAAHFGVALWSPEELDSLESAALMRLFDKLNETTRFTSLPLRTGGWGAGQLCLSRWGVLPPARWAAGYASPFPPGLSMEDMMRGVDLAVVVTSAKLERPPAVSGARLIAIGPDFSGLPTPAIAFISGQGGTASKIDYDPEADAYTASRPEGAAERPSPARIVNALLMTLRGAR